MKRGQSKILVISVILLILCLSGCDEDRIETARTDAVISTINEESLSEDNKERGLKDAYNDENFFTRFYYAWAGMWSKRNRYELYAEEHPGEVLDAQLNDYYKRDAADETKREIDKKANSLVLREWLQRNLTMIVLVVVGVLALVFLAFYLVKRPKPVPELQPVSQPDPVPKSQPIPPKEIPAQLEVNYERGLRIYCDKHGEDYNKLLKNYNNDAEAAFEAVYHL